MKKEEKEIKKKAKKKWVEQLLKIPSQHGAPRVQEVRIISKLANSILPINNHHLSYVGEVTLSIMANRKTRAARQLPPQSHSTPTAVTPPLIYRLSRPSVTFTNTVSLTVIITLEVR